MAEVEEQPDEKLAVGASDRPQGAKAREGRRAEALRENLKRRKAQARARQDGQPSPGDAERPD